jgi:magnesium transporter
MEILSHDTESLQALAKERNVHPLALEDCLHRDQLAKLEDYGHHQLLVWFLYVDGEIYELQFLLFPDLVVLVPHANPPRRSTWKEYLRVPDDNSDLALFIFHLLDFTTDISRSQVSALFREIQDFDQELFQGETRIESILPTRRKLAEIERHIDRLPSVSQQTLHFFQSRHDLKWKFRDLQDHCDRLYQSVVYYQSQITSSFELYWAVAAQKTNLQVKKLTLLASFSLPLTFWASFFGMNFEALPFSSPFSLPAALVLMLLSAGATYLFLRAKGFLAES